MFTHDTDVYKREIAIESAGIGVLATEKATNCFGGLGLGTKIRAGLFGEISSSKQIKFGNNVHGHNHNYMPMYYQARS